MAVCRRSSSYMWLVMRIKGKGSLHHLLKFVQSEHYVNKLNLISMQMCWRKYIDTAILLLV